MPRFRSKEGEANAIVFGDVNPGLEEHDGQQFTVPSQCL